jgi:pSer/pThr/pTyr-binding forkhead associated (FHA) protein
MKIELSTVESWISPLHAVVETLPVVLGRNAHADIWLADQWASRAHCELYDRNGMLAIRDLGSKHGTYVNGARVSDAIVRPGDNLRVGVTTLKVTYEPSPNNQPHARDRGIILPWFDRVLRPISTSLSR